MKSPRFRVSLFRFLVLIAILGPGVGFTVRAIREQPRLRERNRLISTVNGNLYFAGRLKSVSARKKITDDLASLVDTAPCLRPKEREKLKAKIEAAKQELVQISN